MSVAFWSAVVSKGKPVEVQPPEGFVLNLQQAAVVNGKGSNVLKVSTIAIEGEKIDAVIGTLRTGTTDQIILSLVFGFDVPATFSTTGDGEVHLSGYYQPGPDDGEDEEGDDEDFDDEDEDSEDEEEDDEHNAKLAQEMIAKLKAGGKADNSKGKVVQLPSDSEEDEEESSEDEVRHVSSV